MKKRRGFFTYKIALVLIVLGIIFSAGSVANISLEKSIRSDEIKDEVIIIDNILKLWCRDHSGRYIDSLERLKTLELLKDELDITNYKYTTRNDNKEYHLEVDLPVGEKYISPGSNY